MVARDSAGPQRREHIILTKLGGSVSGRGGGVLSFPAPPGPGGNLGGEVVGGEGVCLSGYHLRLRRQESHAELSLLPEQRCEGEQSPRIDKL